MNILKQLAIILVFCLMGEALARALPLKLPAGVWGIALLFTAFSVKLLSPKTIEKTSNYLLSNMGLFFLPPAVAIVEQFELLRSVIVRFAAVAVLTTVITFLVTYGTVSLARRFTQRRPSNE
ncbi:MAG: CidA/LrgA family protein [Spirochaetaceae bacterium]|jgi:holin-like protein|nr:CidA/LrgA family protein [Spirochaetaceae bacterium]